jgi:hypothetical protein
LIALQQETWWFVLGEMRKDGHRKWVKVDGREKGIDIRIIFRKI